jgi:hypothetical protein
MSSSWQGATPTVALQRSNGQGRIGTPCCYSNPILPLIDIPSVPLAAAVESTPISARRGRGRSRMAGEQVDSNEAYARWRLIKRRDAMSTSIPEPLAMDRWPVQTTPTSQRWRNGIPPMCNRHFGRRGCRSSVDQAMVCERPFSARLACPFLEREAGELAPLGCGHVHVTRGGELTWQNEALFRVASPNAMVG